MAGFITYVAKRVFAVHTVNREEIIIWRKDIWKMNVEITIGKARVGKNKEHW
jgi:hypothetical protein